MKKTSILLILLAISVVSFGQKKKKEKFHSVYGFMPTSANFYVGTAEVTVSEWLSYIMDLVTTDNLTEQEVMALLPSVEYDVLTPYFQAFREGLTIHMLGEICSTCERTRDGFGSNYYLKFPDGKDEEMKKRWKQYRHIPITGITHEQALAYIAWLTPNLNAHSFRKGGSIKLRLPTPAEMEEILQRNTVGPLSEGAPKAENDTINSKGCYLFNFHALTPCPSSEGQLEAYGYTDGLVGSYSYWPSALGMYSLYGNAAEMTSQKGVAKGGSYIHWAKECNAKQIFNYNGPKSWLGFRIVADVVPPKK